MDGKFVENNTVELITEYAEYLNSITNIPVSYTHLIQLLALECLIM